jgi:hypothetical protein
MQGVNSMKNDEQAWGEPVMGCRLGISVGSPRIPAGSPINLVLIFRNDGPHQIRFGRMSMWFDYEYSIVDGKGRPVPLTRFGNRQKAAATMGAAAIAELAPGKELTSKVEISRLYDFSLPGPYVIQAWKEVPDPSGKGFIKVTSNKLEVEVTD